VTGLWPLVSAPVELLVAPELPELVELVALVEGVVLVALVAGVAVVAVVALPVAAEVVNVLRASAGSWPVISTTAINDHTARNSATDPPTTRARMRRTRARRVSLILIASSLVMSGRIGSGRSIRVRRT
jgi:hypothetical protein